MDIMFVIQGTCLHDQKVNFEFQFLKIFFSTSSNTLYQQASCVIPLFDLIFTVKSIYGIIW